LAFKNSYGNDNFYIPSEDGYDLLVYKRYIQQSNDGQSNLGIAEYVTYKGHLILYLTNCENIRGVAYRSKYTKNSLQGVFNKYYKQTGNYVLYQVIKEKKQI